MNHLKLILSMILEIYQLVEKELPKRTGPQPEIPDVVIIQLVILKNLLGFKYESSFLRFIQNLKLKSFFPRLPERSRFNRRLKILSPIIERIQFELLKRLKADDLKVRIIDTTPFPIVKLARRNQSKIVARNDLKVGYCSSQKYYYIGLKLSLAVNLEGVPTYFQFHPANKHDIRVLNQEAFNLSGLVLVGDKGYISQEIKDNLKQKLGIALITPYRKNQKNKQLTKKEKQLLKNRKLIETVINQLKDQFNLDKLSAKSLLGFKERVRQIILTYTFGIYFNKQTKRNILSIKSILI
jgi:hypothetical protein